MPLKIMNFTQFQFNIDTQLKFINEKIHCEENLKDSEIIIH